MPPRAARLLTAPISSQVPSPMAMAPAAVTSPMPRPLNFFLISLGPASCCRGAGAEPVGLAPAAGFVAAAAGVEEPVPAAVAGGLNPVEAAPDGAGPADDDPLADLPDLREP